MIKKAREELPPEGFVTDFNRMIYQKILDVYDGGGEVGVSGISQGFSVEEAGAVSRLVNTRESLQTGDGALADYINAIRGEKDRITPSDIAGKPPDELDLYLKQLREKKK